MTAQSTPAPGLPELPKLPKLPPYTCDATTGHVKTRKDDDLLEWGLACYEAGSAAAAQAVPEWISVEDRLPEVIGDEDTPVWSWDGQQVREDNYGTEWDQPAGAVVGGWVRIGNNFDSSGVGTTVTHWMARSFPAPPGAAPTQGAEGAAPQAVEPVVVHEASNVSDNAACLQSASHNAPQAPAPQAVGEASEDGMVAAFPVIALGHGLVEIGDATWEGLNALFFGKNGADVGPIGSKRDRNDKAQDGETLALITFTNLKGLEQVEDALSRVRRNMEASQGEAK